MSRKIEAGDGRALQPCGWFGDIPAGWSIKPLKIVASINDDVLPEDTLPDEEIRYVDVGSVNGRGKITSVESMPFEKAPSRARRRVRHGDTIVSTVRTYLRAIAPVVKPPANLIVSTGFAVVRARPSRHVEAGYLAWLLRSAGFVEQVVADSVGVSYPAIAPSKLGDIRVPVPALAEQHAIAAFLDRETARIDRLIAAKRRLIELLREKRRAVIDHAVTKGLDPDAPMKGSGVEWLGEVPAHWEVKPLMHLTVPSRQIMYGIVLPGPHFDGGRPIVKGGDVAPGRLRLDLLSRTDPEIEAKYERSRLHGGDIVYAIRGSIGACELVPDGLTNANLTQDAARVAPRLGVHEGWLLHALRAASVFAQLDAGAVGATIRGINIYDLKRARIPVPPPADQEALANFCDAKAGLSDAAVEKVESAVTLLEEHRAALIAAAVTGKIDVRAGASARAPEAAA